MASAQLHTSMYRFTYTDSSCSLTHAFLHHPHVHWHAFSYVNCHMVTSWIHKQKLIDEYFQHTQVLTHFHIFQYIHKQNMHIYNEHAYHMQYKHKHTVIYTHVHDYTHSCSHTQTLNHRYTWTNSRECLWTCQFCTSELGFLSHKVLPGHPHEQPLPG